MHPYNDSMQIFKYFSRTFLHRFKFNSSLLILNTQWKDEENVFKILLLVRLYILRNKKSFVWTSRCDLKLLKIDVNIQRFGSNGATISFPTPHNKQFIVNSCSPSITLKVYSCVAISWLQLLQLCLKVMFSSSFSSSLLMIHFSLIFINSLFPHSVHSRKI